MSELEEKIARAICVGLHLDPDEGCNVGFRAEKYGPPLWTLYRSSAKEVIAVYEKGCAMNDTEHKAALARIETLMGAKPGTPEGAELDALVHAVEQYEENQRLREALRFYSRREHWMALAGDSEGPSKLLIANGRGDLGTDGWCVADDALNVNL